MLFPVEKLVARSVILNTCGSKTNPKERIGLLFVLEPILIAGTEPNGKWVELERSYKIDFAFKLPGINPANLKLWSLLGKSFSFPSNPKQGYVESSIYLSCAHNPIDLLKITFGENPNQPTIEAHMKFNMALEGSGYKDFEVTLHGSVAMQA